MIKLFTLWTHGQRERKVLVWDVIVRGVHWVVVIGCVLDLLVVTDGGWLHRQIGIAVLFALALRLAWGFTGSGHARFSTFVPKGRRLLRHATSLLRGKDKRYVGHSPVGAVLIIGLLLLTMGCALSGWLLSCQRFSGDDGMRYVHANLAKTLVALVGIHVIVIVVEGVRHGENVVMSIITGRKRPAHGTDIDNSPVSDRR